MTNEESPPFQKYEITDRFILKQNIQYLKTALHDPESVKLQ